jgi:hypothetical protein
LRKNAGLGVNVMQVSKDATCYLKAKFNALEAFRANCDSLGWQTNMSVDSTELLEFSVETGQDSPVNAQGDYPVLMPINLESLLHPLKNKIGISIQ